MRYSARFPYTGYEDLIRLHITPALGKIKLSQLTPQHVQALLNHMLDKGLSARTAHHARAVLRHALSQAVKWNLIPRNAAALTDGPKVKQVEFQPLTPEQARAFLTAVKGHRLEAL